MTLSMNPYLDKLYPGKQTHKRKLGKHNQQMKAMHYRN